MNNSPPNRRANHTNTAPIKRGVHLLDETPDMVIGPSVKVKGDMRFDGLIKIEGLIDGRVSAPLEARLILTETGVFVGDISGLSVAFIDGRVTGDISVEHLAIGEHAVIHGDIVCKSIEVDCHAVIVGQMQVSAKSVIKSDYQPSVPNDGYQSEENDGGKADPDSPYRSPVRGPRSPEQHTQQDEEEEEENEDIPVVPSRTHKNVLFINEPQVDFYSGGSVATGAAEVGEKIAEFIENNLDKIDEIFVTLDSHYKMHMSQRAFWGNEDGDMPAVGTKITLQDIREDVWTPRKKDLKDYCLHVLESQHRHCSLEGATHSHSDGITILAEHCSIGSQGGAILPLINHALGEWVHSSLRNITYLPRDIAIEARMNKHGSSSGGNGMSVFSASADQHSLKSYHEVYDLSFLQQFTVNDKLYICGQAASHCAHFSVYDVVRTATAMGTVQESREETEEEEVKNMTAAHVYILRDALTTSKEQLGICSHKNGSDSSSRSPVAEFWNMLHLTGFQKEQEETMDAALFNRELQKYKIIRLEDHYRPRFKKADVKRSTKPLLLDHQPKQEKDKSKALASDNENFYDLLQTSLEGILSAAEAKKFISEMKKNQSDITEFVNLEDLNSALSQ